MRQIRKFAALLALSLMLMPATAFAQAGPAQDAYGDEGPQIQEQIDNSAGGGGGGGNDDTVSPATQSADEGGNLPFTGLDLALVVGAGGLLVALGLGMRKLTRPSRQAL